MSVLPIAIGGCAGPPRRALRLDPNLSKGLSRAGLVFIRSCSTAHKAFRSRYASREVVTPAERDLHIQNTSRQLLSRSMTAAAELEEHL
jgi:hypothetical protein